jgi:methylenetetrahydrofolate--tRNA-(uracil-5-)-methyltransferase
MTHFDLTIVGGGLAGVEAAWQASKRGLKVRLYEMRPLVKTGAHLTSDLAELVCSNSLGSNLVDRASGLLKNELRLLGSFLLECAQATAVPAGAALAVDREAFSSLATNRLALQPNIEIVRKEMTDIPEGLAVIASGPLTSSPLADSIGALTGQDRLYFYDAIAPIIFADSINMNIAFRASRYGAGDLEGGDYINCPFTKEPYIVFENVLASAERIQLRDFEAPIEQGVDAGSNIFFEGCLPIEIIARRGHKALAFGPMRPTGLTDPQTGRWPFASVQLRQDNLASTLYNMVGFQTNLTYSEQKRVFRMIPGLEQAEFARFGQMHRNTFIASPQILLPTLQYRRRQNLFFAGQITGVEGYMGNIATGFLAGVNASRLFSGKSPLTFPHTTMIGALCSYITQADMKDFQPMKANFGILPPLDLARRIDKRERASLYSQRALNDMEVFFKENEYL